MNKNIKLEELIDSVNIMTKQDNNPTLDELNNIRKTVLNKMKDKRLSTENYDRLNKCDTALTNKLGRLIRGE